MASVGSDACCQPPSYSSSLPALNNSLPTSTDTEDLLPPGSEDTLQILLLDNQTSAETLAPPTYLYVYVTIAIAIVLLVGIVGNLLVVVVVARFHKMRTRMNYFLVSLSLADMLVLVVCPPVALLDLYGREKWLLGAFMCKLVPYLENAAVHCSALCLLAISVERYVAVCHPLRVVSRRQSHLSIILFTWLLSLVLCLPFFFMSFVEEAMYTDGSNHTICRTSTQQPLARMFLLIDFVVCLVVPLLAITFFYLAIFCTLAPSCCRCHCGRSGELHRRSSSPPLQTGTTDGGPDTRTMRRERVLRMMVTVVVLFYLCVLPMRSLAVGVVFGSADSLESLGFQGYLNLVNMCRLLTFINSAVNPIIYGLMSWKFRCAFRAALPSLVLWQRRGVKAEGSYCMSTTINNNANSGSGRSRSLRAGGKCRSVTEEVGLDVQDRADRATRV